MPRKPRTEREIDQVRTGILEQALSLIQEEGFEGFSMRKLSARLNVSVVTLYRFYESRDHLYLAVLGRGFDLLFQDLRKAHASKKTPEARLRAMARAYLKFGIKQANFYNLMFTWHVPKYRDYVGTPMEAAARHELDESQKVYRFTIEAVRELTETIAPATEDRLRAYIIFFWSALHGYVAGVNNHLLNYMHNDPISLRDTILDHLFAYLRKMIEDEQEKGETGKGMKE